MMMDRGMMTDRHADFRRAWQIYVAHVFLFVVYLVEISYFGQKFGEADYAATFNVQIFLDQPGVRSCTRA